MVHDADFDQRRLALIRRRKRNQDNRAQQYQEAARWLEKVALAYDAAGREDEWTPLLNGLIDRHRCKYKLRPLLEALR